MYTLIQIALTTVLLLSSAAHAEITFEGIFKIEKNKAHVGYAIQRVEWNAANKERSIKQFLRRKEGDRLITEMTYSVSRDNKPFTSSSTTDEFGYRLIKATFPSTKNAKVESSNQQGAPIEDVETIPTGPKTILSAALFYIADITKLVANESRSYHAFSEEDGRTTDGMLTLLGSKDFEKIKFYQVDDDILGEAIESFVTESGDPIGARSGFNKIVTFLTPKNEAIGEFELPQAEVTKFYGDLPEGTKNVIAQSGGKLDALKIIESFEAAKADRPALTEKEFDKLKAIPLRVGK